MFSNLHEPHFGEPVAPLRLASAFVLRSLARLLSGVARRLVGHRHRATVGDPTVEFHAEAGAPEGALYVNGQLIGQVIGVNRL